MAEKLEEPISHVHGWVNSRIAIAVARLYSPMIRGDRLPITPPGPSIQTGTQDRASDRRNKLHVRIITHAHLRKSFLRQRSPALPPRLRITRTLSFDTDLRQPTGT